MFEINYYINQEAAVEDIMNYMKEAVANNYSPFTVKRDLQAIIYKIVYDTVKDVENEVQKEFESNKEDMLSRLQRIIDDYR